MKPVLDNKSNTQITLNCDLGETDLITENSIEHQVMPLIDMANIACTGHAGNEQTMKATIELAKLNNVIVGAHPSYPDRANFGRVSLFSECNNLTYKALQTTLFEQITALLNISIELNYPISYVKPHGALYNDMAESNELAEVVFSVVASINKKFTKQLKIMVITTTNENNSVNFEELAQHYHVKLLSEAFIDRRYQSNGLLTPRKLPTGEINPNAVLDEEEALFQALSLIEGKVTCDNGQVISLSASSLCVHGDNEAALTTTRILKSILELPITFSRPSDRSLKIVAKDTTYAKLLSPLSTILSQYFPTQLVAVTPAFNSLFLEAKAGELDSILLINSTLRIFKNLLTEQHNSKSHHCELPICYQIMSSESHEKYNDLGEIAHQTGLSEEAIISTHLETKYRVEAIGFAPGFAYMSGLPNQLHVPRKTTPRPSVPEGAVAIAGDMSCVYPQSSPGGWNIIGLCPTPVFNINNTDSPLLYQVGDTVSFRAISKSEYLTTVQQNQSNKNQLKTLPTALPEEEHNKPDLNNIDTAAKLIVTKIGSTATIQDSGRNGVSHLGLSVGGAADNDAYQWANRLLDNDINASVIEFVFGNFELTCVEATYICLTGASATISVNGQSQPMWKTIRLEKGDVVKVGFAQHGLRIYLAIQGGVKAERWWGSSATVIKDQIGTQVIKGSIISSAENSFAILSNTSDKNSQAGALVHNRMLSPNVIPKYSSEIEVHLIFSEQFALFSPQQLNALVTTEFSVSAQSDRMGIRLQSNQSQLKHQHHIQSEGLGLGAVQITPEGEPIVMLADRQSIGGYPKVGYLTQADCNKLAQAQPNTRVRFKLITHQQAKRYEAQLTILNRN